MTDAERDKKEGEIDRKMLSLVKVKAGKEEFAFKIKDLERSIRRVKREIGISDEAVKKLEDEITILQEELDNG